MRKIEYLQEYCNRPEVIKVGVYKGVKYIVVMSDCPEVFIQKPNIEYYGHRELKTLIQREFIGNKTFDYILQLPSFVPYQLEEPATCLYNGWIKIRFDSCYDYVTNLQSTFTKREKHTLEEVLQMTCDVIDLMKKFHRVYKDYSLEKAYREIEEWKKQIKEAYNELHQD